VPDADGWFRLPLSAARRARGDVSTRKRALYERRYRLMDEISSHIRAQLQPRPESPKANPNASAGSGNGVLKNGARNMHLDVRHPAALTGISVGVRRPSPQT
jgi:Protein of unknown function (DUF535)